MFSVNYPSSVVCKPASSCGFQDIETLEAWRIQKLVLAKLQLKLASMKCHSGIIVCSPSVVHFSLVFCESTEVMNGKLQEKHQNIIILKDVSGSVFNFSKI